MTIFDLLKSPQYTQKPILEKLVCQVTGLTKTQLFSHTDQQVSETQLSKIQEMYHRYVDNKEPLEYILGFVEFAQLQFSVNPATIIPRPETEYMIEAVREFFALQTRPRLLLDIGTGSGILGLATIFYEYQHISEAYLCDLSTDALLVAQKNKEQLLTQEQQTKTHLLHCSLLDHPTLKTIFQHKQPIVLVANLPYIPDEMFANNADERITKREPTMAFVGGDDGLDLYRQMFDQIIAYRTSPLTPLLQREERYDLFDKEQLQKRGLTRTGGHQPYNINLKQRAQLMRKNMTLAEKTLWKSYLQNCGKTVLRQKIVDHFILDFYIASHRIAIEVDGFSHLNQDAQEYDTYRTQLLQTYGIRVVRCTNEEVLNDINIVIDRIEATFLLPKLENKNSTQTISPLWKRGAGGDGLLTSNSPDTELSDLARGDSNITLFLEMMTRQVELLAKAYSDYFQFIEIKTFHANIRIVQVTFSK